MNYRERFLAINHFIKAYQKIWQNEIMLMYPTPLSDYPLEWIQEISGFKEKKDIMQIERRDVFDLIKLPSLRAFYQQIEELSQFEKISPSSPLPTDAKTFLYMIPKKQHEIKHLAPIINDFHKSLKIKKIVDIGGGIGLLAQTLASQYGLEVTSLDQDLTLQKTGQERAQKKTRIHENLVKYHQMRVSKDDPLFLKHLSTETMSVGLHTCGPLAVDQIIASATKKIPALINSACCYNKLGSIQNISTFAQEHHPTTMQLFALTLATRAHKKLEEKDYDLKMKVKRYRYAFHFLLHDEYNIKELMPLGNSTAKLYDKSFSTYALDQFKRIGIEPRHCEEALEKYFADPARQELIWQMLAGGIIRNAIGRLLEVYLLLDRVLYLEEHGYKVQLLQVFDEILSPRNLGIIANLDETLLSSHD